MRDVLDVLTQAKELRDHFKKKEAEYQEKKIKAWKDNNEYDFNMLMEVQLNAQARAMEMIIDYIQSGALEIEEHENR